MTDIWVPEIGPPQVSGDAEVIVLNRILEEGVTFVSGQEIDRLQEEHEPLAAYLDELGFDLNRLSEEGFWPERTLKIGAALSMLAYRETGYFQLIDTDHFELGKFVADLYGIPEAYASSFLEDSGLKALIDAITGAPDFKHDDGGGYAQVLSIGAGCVRHYMKHSLAA